MELNKPLMVTIDNEPLFIIKNIALLIFGILLLDEYYNYYDMDKPTKHLIMVFYLLFMFGMMALFSTLGGFV